MRVAITGATGLLGRNILFEWIKQHLDRPDQLEIVLLGRPCRTLSLAERMRRILLEDGRNYLGLGAGAELLLETLLRERVSYVEIDLGAADLSLSPAGWERLRTQPIDYFIHCAALTDMRHIPGIARELHNINVLGTRRIMELAASLPVREFDYVGTAYAGDAVGDRIAPDCLERCNGFRCPYEESKHQAELVARRFAREAPFRSRFFRPSTCCGRLMEAPLGEICKFDVFYGWAAFFHRLRQREAWSAGVPARLDMRVCYNPGAGLNIVPADYAAKALYQVCVQDAPGTSFHLANEAETPHDLYIPLMLEMLGVEGVRRVEQVPADPNRLEALYYKTVGAIFTPYISGPPLPFDTENIRSSLARAGLACPPVDAPNFRRLMEYALAREFGASS